MPSPAILARLRRTEIHALGVPHDRLVAAEIAVVLDDHLVAARLERLYRVRRSTDFEYDLPSILHDFTCRFARAVMARARSVAGLLQVHPEVDQVDDDLHMPLRLHGAAHEPERQPGFTVLRDERRN